MFESPGKWTASDLNLDEPQKGEVLVQMVASGLCHSEDHYARGDMTPVLPLCGGHEGSAIVQAVGPGVTTRIFADWRVLDQRSLIKIDNDLPLDVACLVACGVPTG